MTPRLRGLAVVAIGSAVLLTGCGSVPDLNPGIAARVGDETISDSTVRDVAADYCPAVTPQLQGQAIPRSQLNARVAGSLALRSAADQFAADQGVEAGPSYQEAVDQAEAGGQFEGLSDAEKDAAIDVSGAELYVSAVVDAAGDDGAALFQQWLDDHDVRINPRYGVELDGGRAVPTDTSVSFAVSDNATRASGDEPDTTYAATLPETQRCG